MSNIDKNLTNQLQQLQAQNRALLKQQIDSLSEVKDITAQSKKNFEQLQALNNQLKQINKDTFQKAADIAKTSSGNQKGFLKKLFKG